MSANVFGQLSDGRFVESFTIQGKHGSRARIINYGATIIELLAPDGAGKLANIILGFDNLEDYLACKCYYGATVGRCANRIAGGKFTIDSQTYTLAKNNKSCTLHGGLIGFDKVLWKAEQLDAQTVTMSYLSPNMEEGFPGNLHVQVTYSINDHYQLEIKFEATTDSPTLVNLTNHAYFNLKGAGVGTILDHQLKVAADRYVPVDADLIPTGELRPVDGTPFDFREFHTIGERIKEIDGIYDHNFCLTQKKASTASSGSKLPEEESAEVRAGGRRLRLYATQPGLQIFTSHNFHELGDQSPYYDYSGFTLETQHYPDAINQKTFPHDTVLRPGEKYEEQLLFDFSP